MIKIIPKIEVLEALRTAFPKPAKSAERALAKYCKVLGGMLFDSLQRGQAEYERKLNLYAISTSALANKGGQIGKNKLRLHTWLGENNFSLVKVADKGSNLKGTLSKIKLTEWASIEDSLVISTEAMTQEQAELECEVFLAGDHSGNSAIFHHLYPELNDESTEEFVFSLFDVVKVDVESLTAYLAWVINDSDSLAVAKKQNRIRQAKTILAVCAYTGGIYLQRRKESVFGRTYYAGISVQSVPKDLRKAMLGNCWEYDIRSSVIAWKMGFAADWVRKHEPLSTVRKQFRTSLNYLEDKKDLLRTVRLYTFFHDTNVQPALQMDLLKQAFTALSFGARLTGKGWRNSHGELQETALVSIIKNKEERARFVKDSAVIEFIKEQNRLDDWLMQEVKHQVPCLLADPNLKTLSGRISKPKIVAYLYQHAETNAMNIVRHTVEKSGRKVLASIHDAVVVNRRLGADLKCEVEMVLKEKTSNPYWRLGASQYERYERVPLSVKQDERQHRARIAALEAQAVGYKPKWDLMIVHPI